MRLEYYLTISPWSTTEGPAKPYMSNQYQAPSSSDARVFRVIVEVPQWPGVQDIKPVSIQEVVGDK